MPDLDLRPLREVHPDLTEGHEDWEVLRELRRRGGTDGFVTLDGSMLALPKEMVVLHQTRLTLITVENVDNDPVVAWGLLLVHGPQIARAHTRRKAQVWRLRRTSPGGATNPYVFIEDAARHLQMEPRDLIRQLRVPFPEL